MTRRADIVSIALVAAFAALVLAMPHTTPLFHWFYPDNARPVFLRASFLELTLAHAELVLLAAGTASAIALALGIFVTRRSGRAFRPIVGALAATGQTFPPAAVLALAVPALGYGEAPTVLALFLYSILPVLQATMTGIDAVPRDVGEAADALGFSSAEKLMRVELPLAAPTIIAGVRTAVIIAIGTATIGSTIGALSLGSPIVEGLAADNTAYVIQGAILVAFFAITADRLFDVAERWLATPSRSASPESRPRPADAAAAP